MNHSLASRTATAPRSTAGGVIAAIADRLVAAWRDWQRSRDREAARRSLESLSDATLRDIGLARCEIDSVAAELVGEADVTRRYISPTRQRNRP